MSPREQVAASQAVVRGTVLWNQAFRHADGLIYTRTVLRVDEPLKGRLPARIQVIHRGGRLGGEEFSCGLSPRLEPGIEYLLYLRRSRDGTLECTQGHGSALKLSRTEGDATEALLPVERGWLEAARLLCASESGVDAEDLSDQAVTSAAQPAATSGMLGGLNTRFLQPDRGEPIPVLLDADKLPAGMTLGQATNAVLQALNAWTAVTSLKFKIIGITSFGQGADTLNAADETIRIQLHDTYNRINASSTLGIGGRSSRSLPTPSGWELGGNVGGNEFQKTVYGYVVLESGKKEMETPSTFAEVLCHEIGHALNMAHSSETPTDNALLLGSVMYFQSHVDGRGAVLGAYDPPIIRQCYPTNTVPYSFDRVMDVVTAPGEITTAGINQIELRGYDLQTRNLTLQMEGQTSINGEFALNGNRLSYAANGFFADSSRLDPDTSTGAYGYRELAYVRFSDGANSSPYALVRVLSYRGDVTVSPDGLPNYWMIQYFGNSSPSAGNKSRLTDDADGDGLNNREEFLLGTNPKDATSRLRVTSFDGVNLKFLGQAYELYEVLGSKDLVNWNLVRAVSPSNPDLGQRTSLPQTNIVATVTNLPVSAERQFYRIVKVP